jgi:hypothetical protein
MDNVEPGRLSQPLFDSASSRVWVGLLVTEKDQTPVVYDPTLPGVPSGQVYLFNADRGALVPYKKDIVSRYLREVSPEERRQMRSAVSAAWKAARKDFVRQRSRRGTAARNEQPADEEED